VIVTIERRLPLSIRFSSLGQTRRTRWYDQQVRNHQSLSRKANNGYSQAYLRRKEESVSTDSQIPPDKGQDHCRSGTVELTRLQQPSKSFSRTRPHSASILNRVSKLCLNWSTGNPEATNQPNAGDLFKAVNAFAANEWPAVKSGPSLFQRMASSTMIVVLTVPLDDHHCLGL
jgi:hypothetical protein